MAIKVQKKIRTIQFLGKFLTYFDRVYDCIIFQEIKSQNLPQALVDGVVLAHAPMDKYIKLEIIMISVDPWHVQEELQELVIHMMACGLKPKQNVRIILV